MKATVKESIKEKVTELKKALKLSDKQFELVFGVTKEVGIENVLNAILIDLEK